MDNAPFELPTASRGGAERRALEDRRRVTPVRLGLQRRAQGNLRRHVLRALQRFVVLVVADLASFYVMRELVRAVRDHAVLGGAIAEPLRAVFPGGILNGWQYAVALFVALLVTGNYGPGDRRRSPRGLLIACALATALPLWMTIWSRGLELVAVQYVLTTGLVWLGLVSERLTLDRIIMRFAPRERTAVRTLFIGPAEECRATQGGAAFSNGHEYHVVGFVDVHLPPAPDALGHLVDFAHVLSETGAEVVVICGHLSDGGFQDIVDASLTAGCQVLSVTRSVEIAGVHPTTVWRRGQALVELTAPSLTAWQLFLKRMLDLVGSTIGLLVLSPVFAVIGVAVRLESRGPVVFSHRRLGLNGRVFRCLKFRSMHSDAEARLHSDLQLYREYVRSNYKLPDDRDPRLTRVGRLLRRTSLDELPQLINVLKGEMSLVGPRPIVPEELDQYGRSAALFLSLKPGMTGAWQVNGRSSVSYPDRAEIELEYVRNWSLARDLWILFVTAPAVIRRRGAH